MNELEKLTESHKNISNDTDNGITLKGIYLNHAKESSRFAIQELEICKQKMPDSDYLTSHYQYIERRISHLKKLIE